MRTLSPEFQMAELLEDDVTAGIFIYRPLLSLCFKSPIRLKEFIADLKVMYVCKAYRPNVH